MILIIVSDDHYCVVSWNFFPNNVWTQLPIINKSIKKK